MPIVNNVTRLLDAKKIPYTAFELPPEKLGARETARLLQVPARRVFKTIVTLRSTPGSRPVLALIPGDCQLNLKALASALGEKKMHLPTQHEAEQLTGLQAGGISPLALINRGFSVIIDRSALDEDLIHVSGGQRGLNIRLPVKALIQLTRAQIAAIAEPSDVEDEQE